MDRQARSTSSTPGHGRLRRRDLPSPRRTPVLDGFSTSGRARRSRSSGAPAAASHDPSLARPVLRVSTGRSAPTATSARPHAASLRPPGRHRPRRALPLLGLDPRQHRVRQPDATDDEVVAAPRRRPTTSSPSWPEGYDAVVGERGYTCRAGSGSGSPSPGRCSPAPVLVLDDATSAIDVHVEEPIHAALAEHLTDRTMVVIAHRLSTIALAERVVLLEGDASSPTGPTPSCCAHEPRYAEILATRRRRRTTRQAPASPSEGAA